MANVNIIVIPVGYNIFNAQVLCTIDSKVIATYHTISKDNKYNLNVYEYMAWKNYRKHINPEAELLCTKQIIRERYEYYTLQSDIKPILNKHYYLFNKQGKFSDQFNFIYNNITYCLPMDTIMDKRKYYNEMDVFMLLYGTGKYYFLNDLELNNLTKFGSIKNTTLYFNKPTLIIDMNKTVKQEPPF